ncbi:MAG TPA: hypothetical protein VHU84_04340 [Lacipirellulaceae bacterium]|jgi:hypothetical protein|nr:hypothetical protein [Lacipirellulaceae bacterium]
MSDDDINPYAFLTSDSVPPPPTHEATGEAWRDGDLLVCRRVKPIDDTGMNRPSQSSARLKAAKLPDRYVRCNAAADGNSIARVLHWHHPMIYSFLLLTPIVYLRVAQVWAEHAAVRIGLCKRHSTFHQLLPAAGFVLIVGGIVGLVACAKVPRPCILAWAIGSVVVTFVGGLFVAWADRIVAIKRLNRNYVWLKGAAKDYLDELPEFPVED